MDPNADPDLLYIAKEGLNAPLPDKWKACKSENDEIYYFNTETGKSQWEHPLDDVYKEKVRIEKERKAKAKQKDEPKIKDKKEDPLLKAETEKKIKQQKEKLEKEFEEFKSLMDAEYEKKKELARQEIEKAKGSKLKEDATLNQEKEK